MLYLNLLLAKGFLIYPNNNRRYLTTNEELFPSNEGLFKAESLGKNMFENSFKIDQNDYHNSDLNSNSVYKSDFLKSSSRIKDPVVTRTKFEASKTSKYGKKIPMETRTQNQQDYPAFDIDFYKNIVNSKAHNSNTNLFKSNIRNNLMNSADMNTPSSTYLGDYKKTGVDLCMSKAYARLEKNLI